MQSLPPSQFAELVEKQKDVDYFDEITDQASYLLSQRADKYILLNYCGFVLTYYSLLSVAYKMAAVYLFLTQNSVIPIKLQESLTVFAESTLLLAVDDLIDGRAVAYKMLQQVLSYVSVNRKWLKYQQTLSSRVSYYLAHAAYSEQLRSIFCALFEICNLEETALFILSRPGSRLIYSLPGNEVIFAKLVCRVFETSNSGMFDAFLDNCCFLMETPLASKYAQIHMYFLRAFAMATSAYDWVYRKNAVRTLEYFPLAAGDANATLAEINFLERALEDEFVEVRREACAYCAIVISACGTTVPTGLLPRLLYNCFDEATTVRSAALRTLLALISENCNPALELAISNIYQIKTLMSDSATASALATRIYATLLYCGKASPDEHIFYYLNSTKLGQKLTLAAVFPGGAGAFVASPDQCYEQLFLASKSCPELIIPILYDFVTNSATLATQKQIAVLASLCAVCIAVYIESPVQGLLQITVYICRAIECKTADAKTNGRGVEDALRYAKEHISNALKNPTFKTLLFDLYRQQKSPVALLALLILQDFGLETQVTAYDIAKCTLKLADDEIEVLLLLGFPAYFGDVADLEVQNYITCMLRIAGNDTSEHKDVTDMIQLATEFYNVQIGIWQMIALLVEFTRQNVDQQRANRCFVLLRYLDFENDPHAQDAATLLNIAVDIYTNIRFFGMSTESASALCSFIDKLEKQSFKDPVASLVISRVHQNIYVDIAQLPETLRRQIDGVIKARN